jgi:hypothetical protein
MSGDIIAIGAPQSPQALPARRSPQQRLSFWPGGDERYGALEGSMPFVERLPADIEAFRDGPYLDASERLSDAGPPGLSAPAPEMVVAIGTILLACTALYVVPRTTVLGGILLTVAVATHVRASTLFEPSSRRLRARWLGIVLREPRVLWAILLWR